MKKGIIISILLVVIVAVLFFQYQVTPSVRTNESVMEGHSVITLMADHYKLDEIKTQQLEDTLSQLDLLIRQSFNEATQEGIESAETIKKRISHMERVSYLSIQLMMAYEQTSTVNFTLEQGQELMIAAYLHDIRKYAEGNHAKQGEKYIVEHLPSYVTMDENKLECIGKLIKYHSDPLTDKQRTKLGDNVILEELLQDADTADKILNRGKDEEEGLTDLNLQSSVDVVNKYKS